MSRGSLRRKTVASVKTLSAADINAYFGVIGRQNRLLGWQFRQHIAAIRILYCDLLGGSTWHEVDWQYWEDSARELEVEHPTVARQLTPEELSYVKQRSGDGPLNAVRAAHHDLLVRFTTEIRRRGYSYRTEQSYEQWICRFLLFCGDRSFADNRAQLVKSFLEDLVVRKNISASTQNHALNALVFLYDKVLDEKLGELDAMPARSARATCRWC